MNTNLVVEIVGGEPYVFEPLGHYIVRAVGGSWWCRDSHHGIMKNRRERNCSNGRKRTLS